MSRKAETSEVSCEQLADLAIIAPPQDSHLEVLAFKQAFAQLRREHREVLVLGVIHGLTYEQVAEICGCEVGTVKSRVWRARAHLKAMLLGDDNVPSMHVAASARPRPTKKALLQLTTLRCPQQLL